MSQQVFSIHQNLKDTPGSSEHSKERTCQGEREQASKEITSSLLSCVLQRLLAGDVAQSKGGYSHLKRPGLKLHPPQRSELEESLSTLNDLIKQKSLRCIPSHLGFI